MSIETDDFTAPSAPGGGIDWKDHKGRLLLITAHEEVKDIQTSFGPKSAVRADVVVIDGPAGAESFDDTLIFPKVLAGQVRKNIGGKKVLGRLGSGTAKPGQKPPWLIEEASADDIAKAKAYLASLDDVPF